MKRPLAYISAAWSGNEFHDTDRAVWYCRKVYEAGYSPICPLLFMPLFLDSSIPDEHKNGVDMSRDILRRARVLVVCGRGTSEEVKTDIATAARLGIAATTLDGILTIKSQGQAKAND